MIEAVSGAPSGVESGQNSSPEQVRGAAAQFEALLLGQMLKSAWPDSGEDQAGVAMLEMAQEHLARMLAAQGGLGLSSLVAEGLSQNGSHRDK